MIRNIFIFAYMNDVGHIARMRATIPKCEQRIGKAYTLDRVLLFLMAKDWKLILPTGHTVWYNFVETKATD